MSSSRRRGGMDINPKLHMDRQPTVTRITGKHKKYCWYIWIYIHAHMHIHTYVD